MSIRPILSTLTRHRMAAAVIVLQIALTCAIICNAVFLIVQRMEGIAQESGVAESELLQVQIGDIEPDGNVYARTREDLSALRNLPGVGSATVANQLPFSGSGADTSISMSPEQEQHTLMAAMYLGSEDVLRTLGLRLISGRDFLAGEYKDFSDVMSGDTTPESATIVNEAMAKRLFPKGDALGKTIYTANIPLTIVGVVDALAHVYPTYGDETYAYSMIVPLRLPYTDGSYVLRVGDPAQRARVLESAILALERVDSGRLVLSQRTYTDIRDRQFHSARAMVWLLVTVCIGLLVITALGIGGLASFWVAQRTRQIGIRRALGARRGHILAYFQVENFLLTSAGIGLGMLLAYVLNQLLMDRYELPRLPLLYLPVGAVLLWLLGQVAVFWPARRAAHVPPAVATRNA